jgi:hypothetical protein
MSDKPADKPTDELEVEWSPVAKELLARRDRFTQRAIKKDFYKCWEVSRVPLFEDVYATFVADNRYAVIWHAKGNKPDQVKAVVASQSWGENPQELRQKLEETVRLETHGILKSLA